MPSPMCKRGDLDHMTPHTTMASKKIHIALVDLKLITCPLHLDSFSRTNRKQGNYKYLTMILIFKKFLTIPLKSPSKGTITLKCSWWVHLIILAPKNEFFLKTYINLDMIIFFQKFKFFFKNLKNFCAN